MSKEEAIAELTEIQKTINAGNFQEMAQVCGGAFSPWRVLLSDPVHPALALSLSLSVSSLKLPPMVTQARSDCGSFAQGGDLGTFGRGDMMAPFENATYGLGVGEISGIVETDSGVHLIMRYA